MKNERDNHHVALARRDDLVVQELQDEVLIYDLKRHKAVCLNKTAALVWNHCDGQTTVTKMAGLLQQEAGSPVHEDVVWYALDKLGRADLLEERLMPPDGVSLSRRRMVRKLGLGAMLAIPAVISLVAPTVAQTITTVVTSKRVADGTCNTPPGPPPNPNCVFDTCCTGSNRLCLSTGPGSSGCVGGPCTFAGDASLCNA